MSIAMQRGESGHSVLAHVAIGLAALGGLWLTSLASYLLFHTLAELFAVVVAGGIFMIAWTARRMLRNSFLLIVGVAYLCVAVLDVLHTLSYTGMGVLAGYGSDLPTQLWIGARYVEALSLLAAAFFLGRRVRPGAVLALYAVAAALLLSSIFYWRVFPVCYVEGAGLTPFKKVSEYVICLILAGAIVQVVRAREHFAPRVAGLLIASMAVTMASELAFTLYTDPYGPANQAGHLLKIASFYLVYLAIIRTAVVRPYNLLFRDLKQAEERLREERDRARGYLDVASVMMIVIDADHRVQLINKAGCRLLGCEEEEIVGGDWFARFVPAEGRREREEQFDRLMGAQPEHERAQIELPVVTADGRQRMLNWHYTVLRDEAGRPLGALCSVEDITDRREAEEALRASRESLALAQEVAGLGNLDWNLRTGRMRVTDEVYTIFGFGPERRAEDVETTYRALLWRVHPADRESLRTGVRETLRTHLPQEREYRVVWPDGTVGWVHSRAEVFCDGAGRPVRLIATALDITERKMAEDAVRVAHSLLTAANRHSEVQPLLEDCVAEVQSFVGCSAVGMRLLEGDGGMPYRAQVGFSAQFVAEEGPLSADHDACMCSRVIRGAGDPSMSCWTAGGSFYVNDTERFLASLSPEQRRGVRGACARFGYRSIALVPMRLAEKVLGLIHVADEQRNMVSPDTVRLLEKAAMALGPAIQRLQVEQELRRSHEELEQRVQERTAALSEAIQALQQEVEERRRAEAKLIDYQGQLRSLTSELLLIEERERRRIAGELHDRIGQTLAVSKLRLSQLRANVTQPEIAGPLDGVRELLDETVQDTRALMFDLSPPVLYELGLAAAIEWLGEQMRERHGLAVQFADGRQSLAVGEEMGVLLFQAVRELLLNVVKHAGVDRAHVSLVFETGEIRIGVEDEGVGFDASRLERRRQDDGGFGLFNIRERIEHMGGRLELHSEPGQGTRAVLAAPLGPAGGHDTPQQRAEA